MDIEIDRPDGCLWSSNVEARNAGSGQAAGGGTPGASFNASIRRVIIGGVLTDGQKGRFQAVLTPVASSHSCGVHGHEINVKFNDTLVPQTRLGRRAFESQMP